MAVDVVCSSIHYERRKTLSIYTNARIIDLFDGRVAWWCRGCWRRLMWIFNWERRHIREWTSETTSIRDKRTRQWCSSLIAAIVVGLVAIYGNFSWFSTHDSVSSCDITGWRVNGSRDWVYQKHVQWWRIRWWRWRRSGTVVHGYQGDGFWCKLFQLFSLILSIQVRILFVHVFVGVFRKYFVIARWIRGQIRSGIESGDW